MASQVPIQHSPAAAHEQPQQGTSNAMTDPTQQSQQLGLFDRWDLMDPFDDFSVFSDRGFPRLRSQLLGHFTDPLVNWPMTTPMVKNSITQQKDLMAPLTPLMAADLVESPTDFKIHVDLPGVKDIDITADKGYLNIKAKREYAHEEGTSVSHSSERAYGTVQRSIKLPKNCDWDKADASLKDGVLVVTFPKKELLTSSKKIPIKTA